MKKNWQPMNAPVQINIKHFLMFLKAIQDIKNISDLI